MNVIRASTLALSLGLAGLALADQEFEQHGKHEHGHVTLNIAVEGATLAVDFESPAANLIGFEREPRTEPERVLLRETATWLRSGRGSFGVPVAADCRLARADVDVPQAHRDTTAPVTGSKEEKHADYRARFEYRCGNPAALAWIELWMMRRLKDLDEAEVNVVTPALQTSTRLRPGGDIRVPLR
jgi:hypothetical protein